VTQHLKTNKSPNRKHLLNRKYLLLNRPKNTSSFKLNKEARCVSENFIAEEYSSPHPQLVGLKTSFKEKCKLSTLIHSETKTEKYVPQFVNFNF